MNDDYFFLSLKVQNSNSTTLTLQINQFDKITNKLFTTCSLIHKNILRDTKSAKK